MGRVDEPVGDVEHDRAVPDPHQVAAPPVVLTLVGSDALDEHQQVGVDRECGVAGPFSRPGPVGGSAAAPGAVMRLVVQVEADHRRVGLVPVGQGHPVGNPGVLGVGAVVPEAVLGCSRSGAAAVMVEDHPHTLLSGVGDDRIHHLQTRQALEVRVFGKVDTVGCGGGVQQFAGVRQPDGVEPQPDHLVDHLLVAARPQAVRSLGGGLHPEPVDPGDLNRLALGVDDLITRCLQEARRHTARSRLGG